jgi:hypothetical protein
MSGAGMMAALLSLGLGLAVRTDAYADAEQVEAATPQSSSIGDPSMSEATTASFSVERINRSNRSMVVQGPDGSRMTVRVSPTVEGFDKLEKGDQVELDYYASTVLSFGPSNTAAAGQAEEAPTRASAPALGTIGAPPITTAAHVTAVDKNGGALQITTPDGLPQTLLVRDAAARRQLRTLVPGDTVVVTYAEPVAVGLRNKGARS